MCKQDELLAELAELEMEEGSKRMAKLPSVPSGRLPSERSRHRTRKSHSCAKETLDWTLLWTLDLPQLSSAAHD